MVVNPYFEKPSRSPYHSSVQQRIPGKRRPRQRREQTQNQTWDAVRQFDSVREGAVGPSEALERNPVGPSPIGRLHARSGPLGGLSLPSGGGRPAVGGGDVLGRLMNAIRTKESSGNYNAVGIPTKYGRARGAYQFLPSTYSNFARQIGVSPNDWSPAAQDRVARHAMQTYLNQYGDPLKVAVAWYAGPGTANKWSMGSNGRGQAGGMPSIDDYARAIARLMGL